MMFYFETDDFLRKDYLRDSLGEFLRDYYFKGPNGCYSNFEVINICKKGSPTKSRCEAMIGRELDVEKNDFDEYCLKKSTWYVDKYTGVEIGWFWDGDGTLSFRIPRVNGKFDTITNFDCKKSYDWELTEENGYLKY